MTKHGDDPRKRASFAIHIKELDEMPIRPGSRTHRALQNIARRMARGHAHADQQLLTGQCEPEIAEKPRRKLMSLDESLKS